MRLSLGGLSLLLLLGIEYVTVVGTAARDTDPVQKAGHWKSAWAPLYQDQNRGDDYLLLRLEPSRLEVSSRRPGMSNAQKSWLPVILSMPSQAAR